MSRATTSSSSGSSGSSGSRPAAALRWQALGLGIRSSRTNQAYTKPHHLLTTAAAVRVAPQEANEGEEGARPAAELDVDLELRFNSIVFLREFMYNISWPLCIPFCLRVERLPG